MTGLMRLYEFIPEHIDKAYEDVYGWMRDMGMEEEAEAIMDELPQKLAEHNPFTGWNGRSFFPDPTDVVIDLIYGIAKEKITAKYPEASFETSACGYSSYFKIDTVTYDKAWEEYHRRLAE